MTGGYLNSVVSYVYCESDPNLCGYVFGKKVGPSLFQRPQSRLFKPANVAKAHAFFERRGPYAIVLARFVPVVRTVLNPVAGALGTPVRVFTLWQVVGGLVWSVGIVLAGGFAFALLPAAGGLTGAEEPLLLGLPRRRGGPATRSSVAAGPAARRRSSRRTRRETATRSRPSRASPLTGSWASTER